MIPEANGLERTPPSNGGKRGLKLARTLTMFVGLAAVTFLLAAVYSLNLPRLLPF
jgi:hypothetical protein